jgi:Fic family protein
MTWNWQLKNWPQFIYRKEDFLEYEQQFFEKAGAIVGSIRHIDGEDQTLLTIDLMSNEAVKTSEIEGDFLNRNSIQSSIRKHFGLQSDYRKVEPAEHGIAEMMYHLHQDYDEPLSESILCLWHKMLTNGRSDLKDIGVYRTHDDPMQVVSGAIGRSIIHFEAPPSRQVSEEMKRFLLWYNDTNRGEVGELPAIVRASICHLYFECIHPFEDGNGRIGRAISEKALSQSLGRPALVALSHVIQSDKKAYYNALEGNNKDLEIADWIHYFCETILQAQDYTQQLINFIIEKAAFYNRYTGKLNDRQQKVVARMFEEGLEGFKGGLSAKNYASITGAPSATATRDLTKMVELGAFNKTGELKSTRYFLSIMSF